MRLAKCLLIIATLAFAPIVGARAQPVPPVTAPTAAPATITVVSAPPAAVIDTGTYASQAIMWVYTTFGVAVGGALVKLLLGLASRAGIQGAQLASPLLDKMVQRALFDGAQWAADNLRGHGEIEVKNAIVAHAVAYTQVHGANLIKALNDDPDSQKAIDGIKARIATAIADPAVATPAAVDPGKQQVAAG